MPFSKYRLLPRRAGNKDSSCVYNASLADLFKQTAVYEAMQNEAFRARAYEKTALAVEMKIMRSKN